MNIKNKGEFKSLLIKVGSEWKWLLQYLKKYRPQIIIYTLIGIFGTLMGLGSSIASKYLIDAVVTHDSGAIGTAAALVIGMALTQAIISACTSRFTAVVGTRIKNEIRSTIYEHIVCAKWEDINQFHSGDLINRLEGDVGAVSGSIIAYIPSVFTRTIQFFGCLAIVLYYDPTMAIFALLSAPFVFLSTKFTAKMMRKYNVESREMNGKILSYSTESIQNIQAIKAFDLTGRYIENFRTLIEEYRKLRLAHEKFSVLLSLCMSVIGLFVSYSCYGWGVWRLWQGAISYGTMTLFLQLSGSLTASFSALVALAPSAISIATAAGRIQKIAELPLEMDQDRTAAEQIHEEACQNGITVHARDLSYTYRGAEQAVLDTISFTVSPGETIAFVGPSGEGKTTILRLLLGLVEPDSGSLTMSVQSGSVLSVSDSTRRFCSFGFLKLFIVFYKANEYFV